MWKRRFQGSTNIHQHQSKVTMGMIQEVNNTSYTCTVVTPDNCVHEGVPINPMNVGADGQGNFFMPEVNTPVWLCRPSDQKAPFIMAGASLPRQLDDADDEEDPNDHRMNRPVLGQGDQMISGPGSNPFIILRKGGSLEIGSTQMSQRIYLPLQDTIREFFSNWEQNAAGGKLEWKSRTSDDSHGSGKDPVEFRLQVKEFSDEDPMIDLGLGRISDEDAQAVINGSNGQIVGRLLINNNYQVWIDKDGNCQRIQGGGEFVNLEGKKIEFIAADFFQQVRGISSVDYGSRNVVVHRSDSLSVGTDRAVSVNGSLTETISGPVTRTTGRLTEEIKGAVERTVNGDLAEVATGTAQITAGADYREKVGGNTKEIISGKKEVTITNANWLSGEDVGYQLTCNQGEIGIHGITSDLRITMGLTKLAPFGEIRISPTGAIFLENMLGELSKVEINATGIQITTAAGEISIDQLGTVFMGMAGAAGAVVTTLTHPVDYVTGAPILGASSVGASGIPSPVALPSTFVSESL